MANAYGSELLNLPVPTFLEYYDTSPTTGWRTGVDTCTVVTGPNFAFDFPINAKNNLAACETAVTVTGVNPTPTVTLTNPGASNSGWTELTLNLGATGSGTQCAAIGVGPGAASTTVNTTGATWLRFNWKGAGDVDPTARATFGIFKSPLIYRRENY